MISAHGSAGAHAVHILVLVAPALLVLGWVVLDAVRGRLRRVRASAAEIGAPQVS